MLHRSHRRVAVVGIDPGKTNGIMVAVDTENHLLEKWRMPFISRKKGGILDALKFQNIIRDLKADGPDPAHPWRTVVVIEHYRPHGPKNGRLTWWSFGEMFGAVETACMLTGIPLVKIAPKDWQNAMLPLGRLTGRESQKAHSLLAANNLHPHLNITDDNLSDALLIAAWGVNHKVWEW